MNKELGTHRKESRGNDTGFMIDRKGCPSGKKKWKEKDLWIKTKERKSWGIVTTWVSNKDIANWCLCM